MEFIKLVQVCVIYQSNFDFFVEQWQISTKMQIKLQTTNPTGFVEMCLKPVYVPSSRKKCILRRKGFLLEFFLKSASQETLTVSV